jgi:hypothetical protein
MVKGDSSRSGGDVCDVVETGGVVEVTGAVEDIISFMFINGSLARRARKRSKMRGKRGETDQPS